MRCAGGFLQLLLLLHIHAHALHAPWRGKPGPCTLCQGHLAEGGPSPSLGLSRRMPPSPLLRLWCMSPPVMFNGAQKFQSEFVSPSMWPVIGAKTAEEARAAAQRSMLRAPIQAAVRPCMRVCVTSWLAGCRACMHACLRFGHSGTAAVVHGAPIAVQGALGDLERSHAAFMLLRSLQGCAALNEVLLYGDYGALLSQSVRLNKERGSALHYVWWVDLAGRWHASWLLIDRARAKQHRRCSC